jgi:uncharacterized protein
MFLNKLLPDYRFNSLIDLKISWMKEKGIQLILLDMNNTLVDNADFNLSESYQAWLSECVNQSIQVLVCSNNPNQNIHHFAQKMKINAIHLSMKPFPFRIQPYIKKLQISSRHVLVIGDQLFTDVLLGKILHAQTALIKPLSEQDHLLTRLIRRFERYILKND